MPSVKNKGFTLTELIITLSIVAILAALAYPSFRNLILSTRIKSVASELVVTLNLARNEAIKQKLAATVCASSDGSACAADWAGGWLVGSDRNSNSSFESGEILRVATAAPQNISIVFNPASTNFQYRPDGRSDTAGAFQVCDSIRSGETGRQVVISLIGTVSVSNFTCS